MRGMPRATALVLIALAIVVSPAAAQQRPTAPIVSAAATARHSMVAAAHPIAVEAGRAMLARGGSAVDAAIAAALVLNVVEPHASGIGGGSFMLVHDARTRRLIAYDGRARAPASARPDQFLGRDGKPLAFGDAVVGGRSVGVPGAVALMDAAHRRHGKLRWRELFEPAIAAAERGFTVAPRLAKLIAEERLMAQPRARDYFFAGAGRPRAEGERLDNPALGRTLRAIAASGAKAFYEGGIAQDIVDTVEAQAGAGTLTLADLRAYQVVVREPVCGRYRIYRICGMPPPSSGGIAVLQMLAMLERFDMRAMAPASFFATHFFSEAGRLAFADRDRYVGDPAFVDVPAGLLDRGYLAERSQSIAVNATLRRATPGIPPMRTSERRVAQASHQGAELASTSHLSIVDRHGNAVAMTATIEASFGSRLMTAGGFLLNNELTDFSFVPAEEGRPIANRVEPNKRPRSSMAPTIVYEPDGRIVAVVGSAGGSAIINYVAKTLIAILDWRLDPQSAAALANFGSRNGPTELELGSDAADHAAKLLALGHDVRVIELASGTQAIARSRTRWAGGADPRRDGTAGGH
jgi:gamma-glutamyltranspeptidase/glutathione hydrolase